MAILDPKFYLQYYSHYSLPLHSSPEIPELKKVLSEMATIFVSVLI